MDHWLEEWGKRPERKVRPYWWPPSLIIRQAGSALYVGALARWRGLPHWLLTFGLQCLPGAAGSRGMGCIGFPAHPVWEITTACNLRCIHCHASGGKPSADELTTSEAKRLLDQLAEASEFRMMAFTGGEPLVRGDLFELLAYAQALGFTNTMATNATLIDDTVALRLRRHGVVIAAVSLDGFEAATHDSIRGLPGSFEAAVNGMQALRRAGILLHINITAMEYNMDQMEQLMTLVDELGTGILLMYQLVPVGRGRGIGKAALERAGIEGGPLLRLAETVFHGCSAGRGFLYIKPNGDVWPCPFIEVSCGNVRQTPFRTIWASAPILKDLRAREQRLKGRCGECQYRRLCGGCRGRSWAATGDYLAEDPSCFIHSSDGNEESD
jgi:radical SAM protein with 4Fe4S-binding SPASM domain